MKFDTFYYEDFSFYNYISKLLFVTYIAGTFKALFLILG